MLSNDVVYMPDGHDQRDYSMEGDYIVMDSLVGILVWNWKEDTICHIDSEGHKWVQPFKPNYNGIQAD